MDWNQDNTTHQNQSDFLNGIDALYQTPDNAFTNISLGLGCCIAVINVATLGLLLRYRKCIEGTGFWQQLLFLCSADILTGISIVLIPLGFLFYDIHADIYYSFCVVGIVIFPLSFTLSSGNCCIISMYRYVILRYIDQPNTIWHRYASQWMLLGNGLLCIITISSSVLVVTFRFGFQYQEFCDTVNMSGQSKYKVTYLVGTVIIVTAFLIGTNVFTILSLVSMKRAGAKPGNTISTQSLNMMERNRYATVTIVAVALVFNLTTLPSLLFVLVSIKERVDVSAEATEVISRSICMNSLLNPFIYSLRSTEFRNAVWKDIKAVLPRVRCSRDEP